MKRAKMSSPQQGFIEDVVQEFREGLCSALPLDDASQFYDESIIRNVVEIEKVMFLNKMMADISENRLDVNDSSVNEVRIKLDKIIAEHLIMNEKHRSQSQEFLKNPLDFACRKFKASLEARLQLNPDMDMNSLEMFLENEKSLATNILQRHDSSNIGVTDMDEEQKRTLVEKLDHLKKEMLERQKHHLESKEESKRQEVKAHVLEMSTGLIRDTDSLHGQTSAVSKSSLLERVQSIYDYLKANDGGSSGAYSALLKILEDAIADLHERGDILKLKDVVAWVVLLDGFLHSSLKIKKVKKRVRFADMTYDTSGRRCFNVACNQMPLEMGHSWEDEKNQFQSFLNDIVELDCIKWEDRYSDNRMRQNMQYSIVSTTFATWYPYVARYKGGQMRLTCMKQLHEDFYTDPDRHLARMESNLRHLMAQRSCPIGIMLWEHFGDGNSAHCALLVLYPEKGGWSSLIRDSRPINQATIPSFATTLCSVLNIFKITLVAEPPSDSEAQVLTTGCMKEAMKAVGDLLGGDLLDFVRQVPPECSREYDFNSMSQDPDHMNGNGSIQPEEQMQID